MGHCENGNGFQIDQLKLKVFRFFFPFFPFFFLFVKETNILEKVNFQRFLLLGSLDFKVNSFYSFYFENCSAFFLVEPPFVKLLMR